MFIPYGRGRTIALWSVIQNTSESKMNIPAQAAPRPVWVKMRMPPSKESSASTTHGWLWRKERFIWGWILNVRLKHLLFSTQGWTATYGYLRVLRFFFSTEHRPLDATRSEIEGEATGWFPGLTQPTITIRTATTMYITSTFRLLSYKAYIRMINMAVTDGIYRQDHFIGFPNEWAYKQR